MKKPYIFFLGNFDKKAMKKQQEISEKKRQANAQLIGAIRDKWDTISDAVMASTAEIGEVHTEEIIYHLQNVSEILKIIQKNNFQRSDFEEFEILLRSLEAKLDELSEEKLITEKLWELINYSLTNFVEFVSYLMVSSGK